SDLRQQTLGPVLRRLAKEYRTEAQAAADGFFEDAQALDSTVSAFGEFRTRKRLAQLLDQRVVASLNAAEPVLPVESGFRGFFHQGYSAMIRCSTTLQLFAVLW